MDQHWKLPLLLDGATGTNLYRMGLPKGVCVQQWVAEHPDAIKSLQSAFIKAGSDVIYAPTFLANAPQLQSYGLEAETEHLNTLLVQYSREVAEGTGVLVAGDISTTGRMCVPFGDMEFLEMVNVYAQQAFYLKNAGVDLLVIETMSSLSETRAAVIGARQTGLPIFVSMTVNQDGYTMTGTNMLTALTTLQHLGISAFGVNCSEGPGPLIPIIRELAPYAQIPLIAKPNAGVPDWSDENLYSIGPDEMAEEVAKLVEAGALIVGGCCGTTPEHIAAIRSKLDTLSPAEPVRREEEGIIVSCETQTFFLEEDFEYSEPVECSVDMSEALIELEDSGCDVILVHVRTVDDAYQFGVNCYMARLPVAILADTEEALEAALLYYQGRAIVSSRSELDPDAMQALAKGYGAIIL